jgi:hypothetical protein
MIGQLIIVEARLPRIIDSLTLILIVAIVFSGQTALCDVVGGRI